MCVSVPAKCNCEKGRGTVNPFTAPACTISGLKDSRTHLQTVIFSGPVNTLTFNAIRFNKNPFTCQCGKKTKRLKGFTRPITSWQ